jgi:hydrogenase expression/formation protein HypD
MKYVDEYRDAGAVKKLAEAIARITTREWTLMEVCGGQTHAIVRYGIRDLLPESIRLLHGPGCPVCVTPIEAIDRALEIAGREDTIFCSFGDMLRVPGTRGDLLSAKASGADVRVIYSPLDALVIARKNPDKKVVFFAIGFETTVPADAMAVYQARAQGIKNFFILASHVLVPPALETIMSSQQCRVNAFLAAGHVCAVTGYEMYDAIALRYRVPIVVTGFEPLDILQGIFMCVNQLESGRHEVENQYARVVSRQGNLAAQEMVNKVFGVVDQKWRGIGCISSSGLALREEYAALDAEKIFTFSAASSREPEQCIGGLILQGAMTPDQCPAFGTACTPEHPIGAPMVSSEGACAAYYKYGK